ncbi:MAG: hypothetical protein Q8R97_04970, partial [Brevundimonas sp.]|nr:hypothetical protein [Brevundimonas sp.]
RLNGLNSLKPGAVRKSDGEIKPSEPSEWSGIGGSAEFRRWKKGSEPSEIRSGENRVKRDAAALVEPSCQGLRDEGWVGQG